MSQETDTSDLTSVREQLQIIDTAEKKPRLCEAVEGYIDYTELTVEQWLKPSKLSGGRIALRIEREATKCTEFVTVESDTLRMYRDDTVAADVEETGPHIRELVAVSVAGQRSGIAEVRPVLRAETPLAGENDA